MQCRMRPVVEKRESPMSEAKRDCHASLRNARGIFDCARSEEAGIPKQSNTKDTKDTKEEP